LPRRKRVVFNTKILRKHGETALMRTQKSSVVVALSLVVAAVGSMFVA
jgi:hypothetical protein